MNHVDVTNGYFMRLPDVGGGEVPAPPSPGLRGTSGIRRRTCHHVHIRLRDEGLGLEISHMFPDVGPTVLPPPPPQMMMMMMMFNTFSQSEVRIQTP